MEEDEVDFVIDEFLGSLRSVENDVGPAKAKRIHHVHWWDGWEDNPEAEPDEDFRALRSELYAILERTGGVQRKKIAMKELRKRAKTDKSGKSVKDLVMVYYQMDFFTSGFSLDNPNVFASKIHRMLQLDNEEALVLGERQSVRDFVAEEDERVDNKFIAEKDEGADEKLVVIEDEETIAAERRSLHIGQEEGQEAQVVAHSGAEDLQPVMWSLELKTNGAVEQFEVFEGLEESLLHDSKEESNTSQVEAIGPSETDNLQEPRAETHQAADDECALEDVIVKENGDNGINRLFYKPAIFFNSASMEENRMQRNDSCAPHCNGDSPSTERRSEKEEEVQTRDYPSLSKSAEKKLKKLQRYKEKKSRQKTMAKQIKERSKEQKRREWADKLAGLGKENSLKGKTSRMQHVGVYVALDGRQVGYLNELPPTQLPTVIVNGKMVQLDSDLASTDVDGLQDTPLFGRNGNCLLHLGRVSHDVVPDGDSFQHDMERTGQVLSKACTDAPPHTMDGEGGNMDSLLVPSIDHRLIDNDDCSVQEVYNKEQSPLTAVSPLPTTASSQSLTVGSKLDCSYSTMKEVDWLSFGQTDIKNALRQLEVACARSQHQEYDVSEFLLEKKLAQGVGDSTTADRLFGERDNVPFVLLTQPSPMVDVMLLDLNLLGDDKTVGSLEVQTHGLRCPTQPAIKTTLLIAQFVDKMNSALSNGEGRAIEHSWAPSIAQCSYSDGGDFLLFPLQQTQDVQAHAHEHNNNIGCGNSSSAGSGIENIYSTQHGVNSEESSQAEAYGASQFGLQCNTIKDLDNLRQNQQSPVTELQRSTKQRRILSMRFSVLYADKWLNPSMENEDDGVWEINVNHAGQYTQVLIWFADNVGSNRLQLKKLQKLKEFRAAPCHPLKQSLSIVDHAKEQEKETKIHDPSILEESSLPYILWCQHHWNQIFENPNISCKDIGTIREESGFDSDLTWRRLIRSVLEQSLVQLRSSRGLVAL